MIIIKSIETASQLKDLFIDHNRDNYSMETYEGIIQYYEECYRNEPQEFNVNEWCSVTELVTERLEATIEYYTTDDFKVNYALCLIEDTQYNGAERLVENSKNHWEYDISLKDAERVIEHVTDNYSDYVRDYRNYYVGYDSVGSCDFGEQEEEFPEDLNKADFDEDEYNGDFVYVCGRFYYDMSDNGIHFKVTGDDARAILDDLNQK